MTEALGLVEMVRALRAALVAFMPDAHTAEDCAVLVEELATTEKVCVAARVRAAARAGASGMHRERGFADVSDWMARAVGSSTGSAKAALDTAAALEQQPAAKAALAAGELSLAQAQELVKTEAACPGSAAGLLEIAKEQSLKTLKEEARDRRVRAVDPEELHRLQHEAKTFRHWRTRLGTVAGVFDLPPEIGVPFISRIEAETDRLWQKAKGASGETLPSAAGLSPDGVGREVSSNGTAAPRRAAIAADAFVRLVETGGKGKARSADLVIVCDLRAYRRGRAAEGELCHVVGGGPIPVSLAREIGRDAFLKAVTHNGVKIDTIAHFGRRVPAVLRTALDLGPPPDFEGNTCSAPHCDRRHHLPAPRRALAPSGAPLWPQTCEGPALRRGLKFASKFPAAVHCERQKSSAHPCH